MDNLAADFSINPNNPLNAEYEINESNSFGCTFELFAAGTVWGNIDGDINNQTDLINILNNKVDVSSFEDLSQTVTNNYNELSSSLTALTETVGNNYTVLDGKINALSTTVNNNYSILDNRLDTAEGSILNLTDTVSDNYTELNNKIITNTDNITSIDNTISTFGDIVTYNAANFATSAQGVLADTALQSGDNISELVNDVGYITSASLPTNYVPNTRTINGYALSSNITLNYSDVGALSALTTINDLTTTAQQNALNSGATTTNIGQITTNANNISGIQNLIPSQATTSNQLADKSFVNSSIATNTAYFIGTFNSVAELEAYTGTLTNNDYAFVATTDSSGNTLYDRYKWNGSEWLFEYELNNSSFTAVQWSAINSGATSANISQIATNTNDITDLQTNKQDTLTAGANIQINNNIISATDTTYTAGTGISIVNGVISNTQTSAEWGNIQGTLSNQTDLQSALNAKYDASNPNGYISGINSTDIITALDYTPYNATNPDGYITSADLPTNYVTTDTDQNITGVKTFVGDKRLKFKAANSNSKMGFTAYDSSNREVGYLEAQGNGNASHKCRLGVYDTNTGLYDNVLGFEYYKAKGSDNALHRYNLLCPPLYPSTTDQSFYIPMAITDGSSTVVADNKGSINISTLLPDTSNFVTNSNLTTTLEDYTLSASLATVATSGSYNDLTNKPAIPAAQVQSDWNQTDSTAVDYIKNKPTIPSGVVVDQTFDGTSANAQSGIAIEGELANYQSKLVSGTNIKTVNNTSLLGGGNIDTSDVFIAEYGVTSFSDIQTAHNAGKAIFCKGGHFNFTSLFTLNNSLATFFSFGASANALIYKCTSSSVWTTEIYYAEQTSNKVTSISSSSTDTQYPSAKCVYDELQNVYRKRNIGEIITSTIPLAEAGLHLLDGSLISGSGIYADFVNYIAGIYDSNANYFCTESEWWQSMAAYGVCGKFVYDSVNNTVRLPKITGIMQATTDPTVLGDVVEAGLPNITGSITNFWSQADNTTIGALRSIEGGNSKKGTTGSNNTYTISFDASRSNAIYGNSSTVQPQTIKTYVYIVIATTTKTEIEVDIDNIATDLNGKADTDLVNLSSAGQKVIDGQWVLNYHSDISTTASASSTTVDISSYLPDDNYKYEVMIYVSVGYSSSNGGVAVGTVASPYSNPCFRVRGWVTTNAREFHGTGILPVGTERTLYTQRTVAMSSFHFDFIGYRRIGTNI